MDKDRLLEFLEALEPYVDLPSAYRVFVLHSLNPIEKTELAKYLANELNGKYINFLDEKIRLLTPPIGMYSPENLKNDLNLWSKDTKTIVVVDDLEPLFDSWDKEQQKNFFKMVAHWRTECVVLIPSFLKLDYENLLGSGKLLEVV